MDSKSIIVIVIIIAGLSAVMIATPVMAQNMEHLIALEIR